MTIAVIDYGVGNLHSAVKGVQKAGGDVVQARTAAEVESADAIVLPGVGAFRAVVEAFRASGMAEVVLEKVRAGTPFLGICVGLQILADESEEDADARGLGVIPGRCVRFRQARKVPHMGWNAVQPARDCPLFAGIDPGTYFYFVHSYYIEPADPAMVAAQCEYDGETFTAVVHGAPPMDNVFATQFHPEKSQAAGIALLGNFVGIAANESVSEHG